MKDDFRRKMKVRANRFHNGLWRFLFSHSVKLRYRIIARDMSGTDHVIYTQERTLVHVPSEQHVYNIRYSVKVPMSVKSIHLERMDTEINDWFPITCVDFTGDHERGQFKPGWYTLFNSFRWNDIM